MRLLSLSSAVLAAACGVGSLHAEATAPLTPEAQVAAMVQPLRNNDLGTLFKMAPADKQAEAVANWKKVATEVKPDQKAQFDQFLATMLAPNAVDTLMAAAEPQLKQVNPQELVGYVQMFGGMAAMQMANDPSTADLGKNLQQLVADVAAWVPKAGIEDPKKLREALTSAVAAVKSLGVKNADEFYALEFGEMLKRCGGALKEGKAALKVYGLEVDKFLESVKLVDVVGTGDTRTAKAQVTAFDHPYTIPVTLVLKDGRWEVKNEAIEKGIEGLAPAAVGGGQGM
jgi:hypothetical protein